MINVEGYKAFKGKMRIKYKNGVVADIETQFLYKPETDCWYGNGKSFSADICTVVRDET